MRDSAQPFVFPAPHAERALAHWQKSLAAGDKHLFNGELYRLESMAAMPGRLAVHLSRTCYRDQIYGNAYAEELLHDFGAEAMPRGLGVSALVITADNDLLIIRRGQHLGEEPGKLDVVGGHAHPDRHGVQGQPDLFCAIIDELETELNLRPPALTSNVCCGLVENLQTRKPDLVFWVHVHATHRQIASNLAAASEADEVTELLAVPNTSAALKRFARKHHYSLTPSALACLYLLAEL